MMFGECLHKEEGRRVDVVIVIVMAIVRLRLTMAGRPPPRTRWTETLKHTGDLAQLQRAVRYNGPASPCVAGCRSLCWKVGSHYLFASAVILMHG